MKDTRKPYTVASYEAGKKAETREKSNVEDLTYNPKSDTFPFEGKSENRFERDCWTAEGKFFLYDKEDHKFDLFEKD